LIKIFFDTKRIVNYQPLDKNKVISDKDFCNTKFIDITYFYDYIVGDISKDENGKIQHIIRYAITFDKAMTPKDENGISYGEIKLGNNPIFYFIYVDLQDMLNFLKKNNE